MKLNALLVLLLFIAKVNLHAQPNVFNPNDPIVYYDSANPPVYQSPNIQKWVIANTNLGFNTSSYKAYHYKGMSFRLKFPKTYIDSVATGKKYPAMLFFHGGGQIGGIYDNNKQLAIGGPDFSNWVDQGQYDGFLIFPQNSNPNDYSWGAAPYSMYYRLCIEILDSLAKYCKLDIDRIWANGLSAGGGACWEIVAAYPQRIAGTTPSSGITGRFNEIPQYIHIPMWFATGGKDVNPNTASSQDVFNRLKNAGADIKWQFYPTLGHAVWGSLWREPGFLSYGNTMHKSNPLVYFQRYDYCPDSPIDSRIGITAGFYAYEWQKDGATIATQVNGNNSVIDGTSLISFQGNEVRVRHFGTYRIRFKRTATSNWSEWSPKPAVIKPKPPTQTPAIQIAGIKSKTLPAPDGSTTVPLVLPPGYFGYEWKRLSDNTVVSTTNTYDAPVGQYAANVFEQFGCSSISSPAFTIVNANGSPKPDPAKNLTATALSINSIQLDWSQKPNAGENETGFEIYRSATPGGPYQIIFITNRDVVNYKDQGLNPNTQYYYIVRAVGNSGAAENSNEAAAKTLLDVTPPAAPSGLTFTCAGRNTVSLQWNAATDNAGVDKYDVYINGNKSYSTGTTNFTVNELTESETYIFSVRARDKAGNVSQPGNQISVVTKMQGLCYKFWQGIWNNIPDLSPLPSSGMSPNVDITLRPFTVNDYFAFLWEGHINITTQGSYKFQTCSDEGSKFYFNTPYKYSAVPNINNDGLHTNKCVSGAAMTLAPGKYPIAVAFFEKTDAENMNLNWSLNDSPFTPVPDSVFIESFSSPGSAPMAPAGLTGAPVNYKQIDLSWTDLSSNETGFEITRSTTQAGTYIPVATITVNSYSDTTLNASTQYWYRLRAVNTFGESAFTTAVSVTTQAAPAAPATPTMLAPQVLSKDNINVSWTDNSSNETGFEVWRSVGNNLNYRLVATLVAQGGAGTQGNYSDAALFANVTYYYKVRAKGVVNPSAYSAEVNATTQNTAPVISNIPDFTMRRGTSFTLPVNAVDGDGDPLSFTFENLPPFVSIQTISNGNINVTFTPSPGDEGSYTINAFVNDGHSGRDTTFFTMIVNDNTVPTLTALTDVTMDEGDTVVKALHANDLEGNNYMVWYFDNLPSFATFVDSGNGKGSITIKPGYAASGNYSMTVYVDDGNGAWASSRYNITVNEVDPNQVVKVDMKYFNANVPTWNDVDLFNLPAPFNVSNLVDARGNITSIGLNALTSNYGGAGSGAQTGNNGGAFPDGVMRDYLGWGFFETGAADTLTLRVRGLDAGSKYNFIFMGSTVNNGGGVTASTVTTYRIGNTNVTNHYYLNTTKTDTIYQVQPNAAGEIFISMIGDAASFQGGILNGMIIERIIDDGSTPAQPLRLEGSFAENTGITLNWIDRSYNEFGYNAYRATVKAGPYALVGKTPGDATQYVDTATSPLTTYYYYVAGVNNHGTGIASDTISVLSGNNKPSITNVNPLIIKTEASGQEDFTVTDNADDVVTVTIPNLPSFATFSNLGGGNYRVTANPTINDLGVHDLIVTATDDKGGVNTAIVTITVSDKNTRSILVNFGDFGKTAPAPWNNFLGATQAGQNIIGLKDEGDVVTPVSLSLQSSWTGRFTTGHITGNNSGVVPDSVLTSGIYYDGTGTLDFQINGLDNTKLYNIVLVGSQNEGYDASAKYTATGTQADTLNARNNTNLTANLNGITPTGGSITVSLSKLASANFMFLNGIIIEEYSGITLLNPINLYVEPKDRTTAILSWSDRSNNETSFELERAADSLFTQNLTTFNTAAKIKTFIDSSLTPNTRYWYRIRARNGAAFSEWSNRAKTITPLSIVFVNFNYVVANGPSPWNNLQASPNAGFVYPNLKNHANLNTGYNLAITKSFNGENNAGMKTGNNSGMGGLVPDNVLQSSFWIDNTQQSQIKLSGLNHSKHYRIGFIASSNWVGGNLTTTMSINGRTVYINAWQNTNKIVYIGNLVPDQNGELLIDFSTTEAAGNGYNSGILIEAYDDVAGGAVLNTPHPGRQIVEAVNSQEQVGAENMEVAMYPSPFNDLVNLDFNNASENSPTSVHVYDITGRLVMAKDFGRLNTGRHTLRLNTSANNLESGIYMITLLVNGKYVGTTKMIKIKP